MLSVSADCSVPCEAWRDGCIVCDEWVSADSSDGSDRILARSCFLRRSTPSPHGEQKELNLRLRWYYSYSYDLSCKNFGSHCSPGSATARGCCWVDEGCPAARAAPRTLVSGSDGGRGDCVSAGVLIRLTGFGGGGGGGGVCEYILLSW